MRLCNSICLYFSIHMYVYGILCIYIYMYCMYVCIYVVYAHYLFMSFANSQGLQIVDIIPITQDISKAPVAGIEMLNCHSKLIYRIKHTHTHTYSHAVMVYIFVTGFHWNSLNLSLFQQSLAWLCMCDCISVGFHVYMCVCVCRYVIVWLYEGKSNFDHKLLNSSYAL